MAVYSVNKGGNTYFIRLVSNNETYKSLTKQLLEKITIDQLKEIMIFNDIVLYKDLLKCFVYDGKYEEGRSDDCLCGKKNIHEIHGIINKNTNERFIIGSTCSLNWCVAIKPGYSCKYCNRTNKQGRDCINCNGKILHRETFNKWKNFVTYSKEKVDFGIYKDKITYKQLSSQSKYKNYVDYILSQQCLYIKSTTKEKKRLCM